MLRLASHTLLLLAGLLHLLLTVDQGRLHGTVPHLKRAWQALLLKPALVVLIVSYACPAVMRICVLSCLLQCLQPGK